MFAFDITVDVVRAGAAPTITGTKMYTIESLTRLRPDLIVIRLKSAHLAVQRGYFLPSFLPRIKQCHGIHYIYVDLLACRYLRRYATSVKYVDNILRRQGHSTMPKWKKGADHFTVSVNHNEERGYQSSIPKPVMETLGNPPRITFLIKPRKRVEIVAAEDKRSQESTQSE